MATELSAKPDLEELARLILDTPQATNVIRTIVRQELETARPREWHAGLPQEEMRSVMARIVELRKEIAMPPDALEEILEEHRREMGRGSLTDADDEPSGG